MYTVSVILLHSCSGQRPGFCNAWAHCLRQFQCCDVLKLSRISNETAIFQCWSSQRLCSCECARAAAKQYVNTNATRIRCLHVPEDMKKCPAWQKYVPDPSEIVLALYFDGVPAFRGIKYGTYTMHAVSLEILNLPFHLRADPRYTIVSDLVPGPKSPKNFRPVFLPLVKELKSAQYQVLFASADYKAQVQLLQHQFLGYEGCCKCYQRSDFLSTGTYDWLLPEGQDPARRKTQADAIRLGQNARIAGTPQQGFHDIPSLVEVQTECISQTPEDALHLVEGCLKRHLFPILSGKTTLSRDGRTAKHSEATWARWQAQVNKLAMKERTMSVFDQRWKKFCQTSGHTCTAAPFASPGSMSGEDWSEELHQ